VRPYSVTPRLRGRARSYSAAFVCATGKRITRGLRTEDPERARLICAGLVVLFHARPKTATQAPTDVPLEAIRLYFDGAPESSLQVDSKLAEGQADHALWAEIVAKFPPEHHVELHGIYRERGHLRTENSRQRLEIAQLTRDIQLERGRRESLEQTVVARLAKAQAGAPELVPALIEFENHILSTVSHRNAKDHVNGVKSFLLSLPSSLVTAADIMPAHVISFLDAQAERGNQHKKMSRRRAWRIRLSRFFSWLEQVYGLPSPLMTVPTVTKTAVLRERGDIHWHRLDEIEATLKSLPDDYWRALVGTLAFAGLQLAELVWLRKSDVELDGDRGRLWVTTVEDPDDPGSKHLLKTGHRRRHVDIHSRFLLDLIKRQAQSVSGSFLFPAKLRMTKDGKPYKRRGKRASSELWLEDTLSKVLRGHPGGKDKKKRPPTKGLLPKGMTAKSLRRTFGSLLLRSGKSTAEVAAAMGNTEQVVRENYARILGCEVDIDF
jgi:integrase